VDARGAAFFVSLVVSAFTGKLLCAPLFREPPDDRYVAAANEEKKTDIGYFTAFYTYTPL
jgi:hypothetical protein